LKNDVNVASKSNKQEGCGQERHGRQVCWKQRLRIREGKLWNVKERNTEGRTWKARGQEKQDSRAGRCKKPVRNYESRRQTEKVKGVRGQERRGL
jgi:hypothetical protein